MTGAVVIVCAPLEWEHIAGSTEEECATCGRGVWLAPSSQRIRETETVKLICPWCAQPIVAAGDVKIAPPTLEQLAELEGHKRRN